MNAERAASPRKRRRPPKSCEQCRKRKVKCDQNLPCDQCTRLKIAHCSYDPQTLLGRDKKRQATESNNIKTTAPHNAPPTPASTIDQDTVSRRTDKFNVFTSLQSPIDAAPDNPQRALSSHQKPIELIHERLLQGLHPNASHADRVLIPIDPDLHGMITKTRLLGKSHWMNVIKQFRFVVDLHRALEYESSEEFRSALLKVKTLARAVKSQAVSSLKHFSNLRDHLPARDLADVLVDNYFRAFENCYRIIHIPSFRRDYERYWKEPNSASDLFVAKLLLILAIGTSLNQTRQVRTSLRLSALQWINAISIFLGSPFNEKSKISISGVQIYCLMLIAREVVSVGPDMVWISAGALLRTAKLTGLHRDPTHFTRMTPYQSEIRRRLWATVMELCLQASMNAGGPLMMSTESHDCRLPANLNDDDMDPELGTVQPPQSDSTLTQSSLQIALMQTIAVRYQIAHILNDFGAEQSFQDTLTLGNKLRDTLHQILSRLQQLHSDSQINVGQVGLKTYKLMSSRFVISIFQEYALKGFRDPLYYFARKTCLDVSLEIAFEVFPISGQPGNDTHVKDSDFDQLMRVGSGSYKNIIMLAYLMMSLELVSELQRTQSGPSSASDNLLRRDFLRYLEAYLEYTSDRIKWGENSVKGYIFAAAMVAHQKALMVGQPGEPAAIESGFKALEHSIVELQSTLDEITSSQTSTPFIMDAGDDLPMPFGDDFGWNDWDPNASFGFMDVFLQP